MRTHRNDQERAGLRGSRRRVGRFVVCLGLLVCMSGGGCAVLRMAAVNLPESPIAFIHWDRKAAKKRVSAFESAAEMPSLPPNRYDPEREEEENIRAYLRAEKSKLLQHKLAETRGYLTLYWPRTEVMERVRAAPAGSLPLAWSPDHKRLLFVSAHRGGKEQIYEYDLVHKDIHPITMGPAEHPRGDYGADGRLIVQRVERIARKGASEMSVYVASASGRLGGRIASAIPPGTLRLAPDGSRLVYEQVVVRRRPGRASMYESMIATLNLEPGAGERLLLKGREPTITPDGQWIVFASQSSAGYRLRRMRLDGTSRVAISPGGTEERMPSVSPDGEFVAYVRILNGKRILAVRRFDGTGDVSLVTEGWSEFPVW
jgi:dipeptidyl aminopeptidase/acylaminoacyl peptidase